MIRRIPVQKWLRRIEQLWAEEGDTELSSYILVRVTDRTSGDAEEVEFSEVEDGVPGLYRCLKRETGDIIAECAVGPQGSRVAPNSRELRADPAPGFTGALDPMTTIGKQSALLGEGWQVMTQFLQRQVEKLTEQNDALRNECSNLKEQLAEKIAEQGEVPYSELVELAKTAMTLYENKQSTAGFAALAARVVARMPEDAREHAVMAINAEMQGGALLKGH